LRPDVPEELDAIALRALARDPERRFKTAHDMSEELDRFLSGQDDRPTSKSVGRWMESIFGSERASLKKAISQGGEVEATLDRLVALNAIRPAGGESTGSTGGHGKAQPRALWSTSLGSHPSGDRRVSDPSLAAAAGPGRSSSGGRAALPTPASPARMAADAVRGAIDSTVGARQDAPARRTGSMAIALGVGLVLGGIVVVALVVFRGERSFSESPTQAAARAPAKLEIQSDPAGAHVFVDGTPSGLRTPAVLTGLTAGRSVKLRLDKPGYEAATAEVTLVDGQSRTVSLTLRASPEVPEKRSAE
jgi:serine/threonine-protein kinase